MAKTINLDTNTAEELMRDFESQVLLARTKFLELLRNAKATNGKLNISFGNYSKTFDSPNRKAELHFRESAWLKMKSLVDSFESEVAWHGVAYRDEDMTKDAYYITDILCYPQEVSGAKVDTDQAEYQEWMFELPDEAFNNLKMQGHSHVNMSVIPSGTDETNQKEILESLNDDDFYIFMIWNKKNDRNIKIYDLKKNILFEPADISLVIDKEFGIEDFIEDAKKMVKKKVYTYQKSAAATQYTPSSGVPVIPAAKTGDDKHAKKDVKKFSDVATKPKNASSKYGYDDDLYGYDDKDDPCGPFGFRDRFFNY